MSDDAPQRPRLLRRILSFLGRGLLAVSVALVAGAFATSWWGLWGGLVVGIAALGLTTWFLHGVWSRPRARRALVTVVLFWVAFSTIRGLARGPRPDPGPIERGSVSAASGAHAFRVGFAAKPFELPESTTLAGWGMAPRRRRLPAFAGLGWLGRASLGLMGPIFVRPEREGGPVGAKALAVVPEDGGRPLAFVRLDLIYVSPTTAVRIRGRVEDLDFGDEGLVIAASHTHSGPGGTMRAPAAQALGTDHYDPSVAEAVVDAAEAAIRAAVATARPASVASVLARDAGDDGLPFLVQTRGEHADRDRAGDRRRIDNRVLALHFRERDGAAPIAVLLHYAVQPVVLRPRHLEFGADIVGSIEAAMQKALPGHPPVLFLNGHCGDATPKRGPLSGREGADALAQGFAERIASAFEGAGRAHDRIRIGAGTCRRAMGPPFAFVTTGSRRAFEDHALAGPFGNTLGQAMTSVLCLPANAWLWSLGFREARVAMTMAGGEGAVGAAVELGRRPRFSFDHPKTMVGALAIDDADGARIASILWHGGVGTQALLRQWRARAETGQVPPPFVVGMAGDALGYLVTEKEFEAGRYEALSSLYGRRGSRLVEEMLFEALATAAD